RHHDHDRHGRGRVVGKRCEMNPRGGNMKVLSKVNVLAERNGWSIARAQGFVDGEIARRRGPPASIYARVGIDDYCLGFRAGSYVRGSSQPRHAASSESYAQVQARSAT